MNPNDIAPMVIIVTLTLTTGGVLLFRPVMKKLASYLEVATLQKRGGRTDDSARTQELLENLDSRVRLLEDRVQFAESLRSQRRGDALEAGRTARE
jgi:hypothetical protein